VEAGTADAVETARGLEAAGEPKHVTGRLRSHDRTFTAEELLLMFEQRQWCPEMESTAGEDAVKMVEMTTEDLEYDIHLVDKAAQGLRGLTPSVKEVLLWVKCFKQLHTLQRNCL